MANSPTIFFYRCLVFDQGGNLMIVELVSTGTELLLGEIVNTNAPFLAEKLNEIGFDVLYQSVIGDNRQRMSNVLSTALQRADIVITSGGLGPTQGDITKEVTAHVLDRQLYLDERSLERIKAYFAKLHPDNMAIPNNNTRQAMIPEGAIIVDNERGTAPGVITEANGKIIINLPGPPHELKHMFTVSIIPYLKAKFGFQGTISSKILHTFGIGESALEEEIKDLILNQSNPTLALLVRHGEIFVRLTAKGKSEEEAKILINNLEEIIRKRVGQYVFGVNDDTMEEVVGAKLAEKNLTVALAESCTGGLVSSKITDVPGSSAYLIGSVVCYSNQIKNKIVGVPEEVLDEYGAVSEQTAISMACGIRCAFGTDLGVGITGIAGPGGATPTKPIGLVYIAVDGPLGTKCFEYTFPGSRIYNKIRTTMTALNHLRQYIELI